MSRGTPPARRPALRRPWKCPQMGRRTCLSKGMGSAFKDGGLQGDGLKDVLATAVVFAVGGGWEIKCIPFPSGGWVGNQMYSISQWEVGGKSNVFHFPMGGWGGWGIKCIPFPAEIIRRSSDNHWTENIDKLN